MINVKFIAWNGAPDSLFKKGKEDFVKLFPDASFEFYAPDPDILVFLSGGSEREATKFISPGKFYLLAAFEENNSYAAATEVKAYLDLSGTASILTDLHESADRKIIKQFICVREAVSTLYGQTLGLIGEVSDWLLASTIEEQVLKSKFGISLKKLKWHDVPSYQNLTFDPAFKNKFHCNNPLGVEDAGRVHTALKEIIDRENLDALTVECFSLVMEHKVTACLSLSHFNDLEIPAGCEGDICSITGMMFIKALTGTIPWMANLLKVSLDCVRFAHCTAPTALLDHFEIDTHYETGLGTAVAGKFPEGMITIFRFNNTLTEAFITSGNIISTHKGEHACRTQIEASIPEHDAACLKNHPLGNHHLILPGNHQGILQMACRIYGIKYCHSQSQQNLLR